MITDKLLLNFGRVECPSENTADKSSAFHEHHCLFLVLVMFVDLPKENTIMEFIIYGKGIKRVCLWNKDGHLCIYSISKRKLWHQVNNGRNEFNKQKICSKQKN